MKRRLNPRPSPRSRWPASRSASRPRRSAGAARRGPRRRLPHLQRGLQPRERGKRPGRRGDQARAGGGRAAPGRAGGARAAGADACCTRRAARPASTARTWCCCLIRISHGGTGGRSPRPGTCSPVLGQPVLGQPVLGQGVPFSTGLAGPGRARPVRPAGRDPPPSRRKPPSTGRRSPRSYGELADRTAVRDGGFRLNRAVAIAEADGPAAALAIVDALELPGYQYWSLHAGRTSSAASAAPTRPGPPTASTRAGPHRPRAPLPSSSNAGSRKPKHRQLSPPRPPPSSCR